VSLTDAVLELLRTGVTPVPVHDGDPPVDGDGNPVGERYAVLWSSTPERSPDDVGHTSDWVTGRWQVTSVGTSRAQAEAVAVRCRDALVDNRPAAPGYATTPLRHASSSPIRRDDDYPGQDLFVAVDTYTLNATPT